MTPEAIRIVSQLRREFYSLFADAMKVPVSITASNPSTGNPPMASWVDDRQRFNYLRVYVYTAPDELLPERPFILRISVNKGGGIPTVARWRKDCRGLNQSWSCELTLLPEEILDFLPWLVSLVISQEHEPISGVTEPPHPFHSKTFSDSSDSLSCNDAWTHKAWQANQTYKVPVGSTL
jgi:hypothetical protein